MLLNTLSICFLALSILGLLIRIWKLEKSIHLMSKIVIQKEVDGKYFPSNDAIVKKRVINPTQKKIILEKRRKWWEENKRERKAPLPYS